MSKRPSNKKFGYTFASLLLLIATYYFFSQSIALFSVFTVAGLFLSLVTITKSDILEPANNGWMRVAEKIAHITNPIIGAVLFLIFITPCALLLRIMGRDMLWLNVKNKNTYWSLPNNEVRKNASMKNQF